MAPEPSAQARSGGAGPTTRPTYMNVLEPVATPAMPVYINTAVQPIQPPLARSPAAVAVARPLDRSQSTRAPAQATRLPAALDRSMSTRDHTKAAPVQQQQQQQQQQQPPAIIPKLKDATQTAGRELWTPAMYMAGNIARGVRWGSFMCARW